MPPPQDPLGYIPYTPQQTDPLGYIPYNPTPQPTQPQPGQAQNTSFLGNLFTSGNAFATGMSLAGDALGGYAALMAPPLAWATYPLLSGGGGFIGEMGRQYIDDQPFNLGLGVTEGVLNLAPGPKIPGAGAGLRELGKYAVKSGVYGGAQGLAGSVPRNMAEEGHITEWGGPMGLNMPTLGQAAGQTIGGAGVGTVLGGGLGYGLSKLGRAATPAPPIESNPSLPTGSTPRLPGMEDVDFGQEIPPAEMPPIPQADPTLERNRALSLINSEAEQKLFELKVLQSDAARRGDQTTVTMLEDEMLRVRTEASTAQRNWQPAPEPAAPVFPDMPGAQPDIPFNLFRQNGRFASPDNVSPEMRQGVLRPSPFEVPPQSPPSPFEFTLTAKPPEPASLPDVVTVDVTEAGVAENFYSKGYVPWTGHRGEGNFPQVIRKEVLESGREPVTTGIASQIMQGTELPVQTPTAPPVQPTVGRTTEQLPRDLRGARPRYSNYELEFDNDLDKALYIIAQPTPSKRDADYMRFVLDQLDVDEEAAREMGRAVRRAVGEAVRGEPEGVVRLQQLIEIEGLEGDVGGDIAGSVPVNADESFTVPKEQVTPRLIEERRAQGFEQAGVDTQGNSIFKRISAAIDRGLGAKPGEDTQSGSIPMNMLFPGGLARRLRRLLGRELPEDAAVNEPVEQPRTTPARHPSTIANDLVWEAASGAAPPNPQRIRELVLEAEQSIQRTTDPEDLQSVTDLLNNEYEYERLNGEDPAMAEIFDHLRQVASNRLQAIGGAPEPYPGPGEGEVPLPPQSSSNTGADAATIARLLQYDLDEAHAILATGDTYRINEHIDYWRMNRDSAARYNDTDSAAHATEVLRILGSPDGEPFLGSEPQSHEYSVDPDDPNAPVNIPPPPPRSAYDILTELNRILTRSGVDSNDPDVVRIYEEGQRLIAQETDVVTMRNMVENLEGEASWNRLRGNATGTNIYESLHNEALTRHSQLQLESMVARRASNPDITTLGVTALRRRMRTQIMDGDDPTAVINEISNRVNAEDDIDDVIYLSDIFQDEVEAFRNSGQQELEDAYITLLQVARARRDVLQSGGTTSASGHTPLAQPAAGTATDYNNWRTEVVENMAAGRSNDELIQRANDYIQAADYNTLRLYEDQIAASYQDAASRANQEEMSFFSDMQDAILRRITTLQTASRPANVPAPATTSRPRRFPRPEEDWQVPGAARRSGDIEFAEKVLDPSLAQRSLPGVEPTGGIREQHQLERIAEASSKKPTDAAEEEWFFQRRLPGVKKNRFDINREQAENIGVGVLNEATQRDAQRRTVRTTTGRERHDPTRTSSWQSFSEERLNAAGDGPPKLSMETDYSGSPRIVYRGPDGKPRVVAELRSSYRRPGKYYITNLASKVTKEMVEGREVTKEALLTGRAFYAVAKKLVEMDALTTEGVFSEHTAHLIAKARRMFYGGQEGFTTPDMLTLGVGRKLAASKASAPTVTETTPSNAKGEWITKGGNVPPTGGGNVPPPTPPAVPPTGGGQGPRRIPRIKAPAAEKKPSWKRELLNLTRAITTTWDLSAPLRQGAPLIATRQWWKSWNQMLTSFGSEGAYQKALGDIRARELFAARTVNGKLAKSFADTVGLEITDVSTNLSRREEAVASNWAETGQMFGKDNAVQRGYQKTAGRYARASNRAYTAFLNQLRADTFESLMKDAKKSFDADVIAGNKNARDPFTDLKFAKEIADFVNTATGRGPLKLQLPVGMSSTQMGGRTFNLPFKEVDAGPMMGKLLSETMFAPKLIASRMRMLNPATYMMASPFVRKQYLKSALTMATTWATASGVAAMAGADVSMDPNSADFGKIRIGNTRLDPAAGFQQYLVALSRLVTGRTTSSGTGREFTLGEGYRADTRKDIIERFAVNKLHPAVKFAYDILNASQNQPFQVADRTAQMFVPLIAQDLVELAKSDPKLIPIALPLIGIGMGSQTYEKGEAISKFLPPEADYVIPSRKPGPKAWWLQ